MRGIPWHDIHTVRLVAATHPVVVEHQRRVAYWTTLSLDAKFRERTQERERLAALFGRPFEHLMTPDALLDAFLDQVYQPPPLPQLPPPTCQSCHHCAPDRYHPGRSVCWQGWTGGRPFRLTTMQPCAAFVDTRPQPSSPTRGDIHRAMTAFLERHGVAYSAARWKGHRSDLAREAGTWGFQVGRQWEQDVRAWLTSCYGEDFFAPERWLVIETRAGARLFREVDGIEWVDASHAYVYEIKHRTRGFTQVTKDYIPLLQWAFPATTFTPVEINASDPYDEGQPQAALPIRRLRSLEDRTMDGQYQLLVLRPELEAEAAGYDPLAAIAHLRELRCRECGGPLWESEEEILDFIDFTKARGVPQTPFDVCDMVGQLHPREQACAACSPRQEEESME